MFHRMLCRYEAALALKNQCLTELSLGEVLQVLNLVINMKKWITHPQSGWKPVTITLEETKTDAGTESDA